MLDCAEKISGIKGRIRGFSKEVLELKKELMIFVLRDFLDIRDKDRAYAALDDLQKAIESLQSADINLINVPRVEEPT